MIEFLPAPADLDAALVSAVTEAVSAVNQTSIARAICRSQNGGRETCLCDRREWRSCHAPALYGDMALAVLSLLRRSGVLGKEARP